MILKRLIIFILLPGLLVDPALAHNLGGPSLFRPIPKTLFTQEALSTLGEVERSPLNRRVTAATMAWTNRWSKSEGSRPGLFGAAIGFSLLGKADSKLKTTRRRLFQTAVLLTPAAALAEIWKEGVGNATLQPIQFNAYTPAAWVGRDEQNVYQLTGELILQARDLIQQARSGITPQLRQAYLTNQLVTVSGLEQIPAVWSELLDALEAHHIVLSTDPQIQANQIIYVALPSYFARRGLFLKSASALINQPTSPLPSPNEGAYWDILSLQQIAEVRRKVPKMIWGENETADEVVVGDYAVFSGQPLVTSVGRASGETIYGNVIYYDNVIASDSARKPKKPEQLRTLEKRRPEWELFTSRRCLSIRFIQLARKSADGSEHPCSLGLKLQAWLRQHIGSHERQHLRDFRLGRYNRNYGPDKNYDEYDQSVYRWFITHEVDAKITERVM